MPPPKTLLQLAGAEAAPAKIGDACLILIDLQKENLEGPIAVPKADQVVANATLLLESARASGTDIPCRTKRSIWIY
jgi:hypothetical protein